MHISRCDDPAYLSFARQLLRSLSNVKNGIVTKHIGDVTVTLRKVFGHEYVSIASGGGGSYLFFTTGDGADQLAGYSDAELLVKDPYLFPEGYFVKVTANSASIILTTKPQGEEEQAAGVKGLAKIPYEPSRNILEKPSAVRAGALGAYPLQVSGLTEPVRYASDFRANHSVWSQYPCNLFDIGYDVIGNVIGQGGVHSIKEAAADTDWPRQVSRCTRITPKGDSVELIVIVTQALEVCAYRTSVCDGVARFNPLYPQQFLNVRDDGVDYVARARIPLPDNMVKNKFDGEARARHARGEHVYAKEQREVGVRVNSTSTRLCFVYDVRVDSLEAHKKDLAYSHFVEFGLDISVGEKEHEVQIQITNLRTFTPEADGFYTYDCDYVMAARNTLKNKFAAIGCATDDLILVKNPIKTEFVAAKGFDAAKTFVQSKHNVFYITNATKNKNIISIPHTNQANAVGLTEGWYDLIMIPDETNDFAYPFFKTVRDLPVYSGLSPAAFDDTVCEIRIEALELRSLSVAYYVSLKNTERGLVEGSVVYVHGVKEFSTNGFDDIYERIIANPRLNRSGVGGGTTRVVADSVRTHRVESWSGTVPWSEDLGGGSSKTTFSSNFDTYASLHDDYGQLVSDTWIETTTYSERFGGSLGGGVSGWLTNFTYTSTHDFVLSGFVRPPYIREGLIEGMSGSRYLGEWLDPTTIFITNPNGDWAYRGFYKTKQTPSEKTTSIGDVCVFDQIVFYDKNGVAKVTTHKAAFEKASGKVFTNAFSAEALAKTYDAKFYDICFGTTRTDLSSFGQLLAVIKFAKSQIATSKKKDSKGVVRMPILSAHASFL